MTKKISADNLAIAVYVRGIFGEECSVYSYLDEAEKSSIHILTCTNSPFDYVNSFATLGLSDYKIGLLDENNVHLGVEFVGAIASKFDKFGLIVSTCGFNIINSHFKCSPGVIFKNVIHMYYPELSMRHVLFGSPFGWQKEFETMNLTKKTVTWLHAIPISDTEMQYADRLGTDALENLFEKQQIDIYDLNRNPVVY